VEKYCVKMQKEGKGSKEQGWIFFTVAYVSVLDGWTG